MVLARMTKRLVAKYFVLLLIIQVTILMCVTYLCKNTLTLNSNIQDTATKLRMKGPIGDDDPSLIDYLRTKILQPPSQLEYNLSTHHNLMNTIYKHGYSWLTINRILQGLFNDTRSKFFVEAGALDGEFLSNTLWLEKKLGWNGLLVEPEDTNFRDMVWKRRKAWIAHSCLSNAKFPKEVVMVSTKARNGLILPSLFARGSSYLQSYESTSEQILSFYSLTDKTYYSSQCYPLYSYLKALNVSVIDFLSLDLQGADLDVFNTIPLDRIYIRSLILEDTSLEMNIQLIENFHKLGFYFIFNAVLAPLDYFFINANDSVLMDKTKSLEI